VPTFGSALIELHHSDQHIPAVQSASCSHASIAAIASSIGAILVELSGGEGAGLRLVLVFGVHYAARASRARAWYN
jgi:hypothetical protein